MLLNPNLYNNPYSILFTENVSKADEPLQLFWQQDLSGGNISHLFRFAETARESEDIESLKLRIACHYLLDLVSDKGLPELLESIREVLDFYEGVQSEFSQPVVRTRKCGIGQKYERPVFNIEQE